MLPGRLKIEKALRKAIRLVKRNWILIVLLLLIAGLGAGIWLNPPAIYFDGTAEQAEFSLVSDRQVSYSIRRDYSNNGKIMFGAGKTETIYVVNASAPAELIQEVREGKFTGWETSDEVFPFIDGSATLSSEYLLHLMLEMPEGGSFTYDIEIARDEGDGEGERSRIELKNFSEDLLIELSSIYDINMKGTTKVIPKGLYLIIGCRSIAFYAVPSSPEDSEPGPGPQMKGALKHFRFQNAETNSLEITYLAETASQEVGHIEIEGNAKKGQQLSLEISDTGQHPLPIKINGRVGSLKLAGVTCKPNLRQWLFDKRSELLSAIAGACIGILVKKALEKKPGSKEED